MLSGNNQKSKTSIELLEERINEKINSGLPIVLFEKLKRLHAKFEYKSGCICSYCLTKRLYVTNGNRHNNYGKDKLYKLLEEFD